MNKLTLMVMTIALCNCGSFTQMRPADTQPDSTFDTQIGYAASEILPFGMYFNSAYGLSDRLEGLVHYETNSSFYGMLRYGILQSKSNGWALALGFGAGSVYYINESFDLFEVDEDNSDDDLMSSSFSVLASLTLGKKRSNGDSFRVGIMPIYSKKREYLIVSTRFGYDFDLGRNFHFNVELGGSFHDDQSDDGIVEGFMPELALGFGF